MPPLTTPARSSPQSSAAEPSGAGFRFAWLAGRAGLLLAIAGPALVAAALTAYHLSSRSLWLDEAASIAIASQHGSALWRAIRHDGGNMLIYYLLLHVLIGWFGAGEAVVRLPSVVADAATAALTAALAWRLAGRLRVALGAGLLAALSLPLVFWGQDARGYALMVTLATGSMLAFTGIVQSRGAAPRRAVLAYVVLTLLSLYVSFYAGLIVLAQLALLPGFRHRARLIVGCLVLVAAACVPLVVLAVERGSGQLFWVARPTASTVAQAGAVLLSAGLPPNFRVGAITIAAAAVTVAVALVLVWRALSSRPPRAAGAGGLARSAAWIAAGWLIVPTVVMLVAGLAGEPIELQRSIILVIPAVGLLFAWGLDLPAGRRRGLGLAGLALLLVMRVLVLAPTYGVTPENWQAAAAQVARASHPGDCLLFYPQDGRMPFDYYLRGTSATARLTPVLPTAPWRLVRPYVEDYAVPSPARLDQIVHACPRLWVVASHQGQRTGPAASVEHLIRYHRLLADLRHAYRSAGQRQFGYAARIYVTLLRR